MIGLNATLPLRVGLLDIEGTAIDEGEGAHRALEQCAATYREAAPEGASAGSIEGVQIARSLFRMLKIDPTRHRPSSEAMLRRALKGLEMPRINTLVDLGNWCSLEHLLPLGIYDRAAIRGDITLREGGEGEGYDSVANQWLNLGGRYLLADDEGPFGSPMKDSKRTMVSIYTEATIIVLYAPAEYPADRFAGHLDAMAGRIVEYCGGTVAQNMQVVGAIVGG